MVGTVRIPIAKPVLDWAIARTGSTIEELAQTADFKQIENWVRGTSQPTIRQAEALAAKASLPYPLLLLEQPRLLSVQLPDFRTVASHSLADPSVQLAAAIERAQNQLDWYLGYADDMGLTPPAIVGCAQIDENAEAIAERLGTVIDWTPGIHTLGDQAVAALSSAIEDHGILVTRNSMVGNNPSKPLRVEEFRGFTLVQDGFALIFVNSRDAKSAQLFSLAHELGHVVLGAPGISNESVGASNETSRDVEQWCNAFAASLLMPARSVRALGLPPDASFEQVQYAARKFGVSIPAFVYRLQRLHIIRRQAANALLDEYAELKVPQRSSPSGGDAYRNIKARTGERLLSAVRVSAGTPLLPIRDALDLTGLAKRESLDNLFATLEEN